MNNNYDLSFLTDKYLAIRLRNEVQDEMDSWGLLLDNEDKDRMNKMIQQLNLIISNL